MKICVLGAGAIGGTIGGRLALAGEDVTLIARGPQLDAIRSTGLQLCRGGESEAVKPDCTDDVDAAGPHEVVIVALKAPSLPTAAIEPLLGPKTVVATAGNGIPWWYFHRTDTHGGSEHLASVDPAGEIWRRIGARRAVGMVVSLGCRIVRPGVVEQLSGNEIVVGEPDGTASARITRLAGALGRAGFEARITAKIRDQIWDKMWGNSALNPICALTGSTVGEVARDPKSRALARRVMSEIAAVAAAMGVELDGTIEARLVQAARYGRHQGSMAQDLQAGRPTEIDALVGALSELGGRVGVPTPTLDIILALMRRLSETDG